VGMALERSRESIVPGNAVPHSEEPPRILRESYDKQCGLDPWHFSKEFFHSNSNNTSRTFHDVLGQIKHESLARNCTHNTRE